MTFGTSRTGSGRLRRC